MRIPFKNKLLAIMFFSIIVYISGCVDTSVNPIPSSIDYSSQMKIVNLVAGAGQATITLSGQSLGTVDFGGEMPGSGTDFLTVPSGSKTLNASFSSGNSETYQFAAATEYKIRVYLVGTNSSSEVVVASQRYIWQTKNSQNGSDLFPADTGWVAFFNGSPDAVLNSININGEDTDLGNLAMGDTYSYMKLAAGSYTFDVTFNDSLNTTFDYTVASKDRYTAVIFDSAASIKSAVFIDD